MLYVSLNNNKKDKQGEQKPKAASSSEGNKPSQQAGNTDPHFIISYIKDSGSLSNFSSSEAST